MRPAGLLNQLNFLIINDQYHGYKIFKKAACANLVTQRY